MAKKTKGREMNQDQFTKGIDTLTKVFPNYSFDPDTYWTLLNDLSGEDFNRGITKVCQDEVTMNKGINLIALIRKHSKKEGRIGIVG